MPIFVIQEHNSRNLHWDFRLEIDGVLKSWALPKSPPEKEGVKRLAIEVDDHDLSYADFEGVIKEGYGKGSVKIWDRGDYEIENKKPEKIVFNLHGKKLKGKYVLVKTKFGKKDNNWLLFKS
ncbi:MAG: DNA polymerase ligase N-terminal domain-containing protein [Nanoarchaeota archaeon]